MKISTYIIYLLHELRPFVVFPRASISLREILETVLFIIYYSFVKDWKFR